MQSSGRHVLSYSRPVGEKDYSRGLMSFFLQRLEVLVSGKCVCRNKQRLYIIFVLIERADGL